MNFELHWYECWRKLWSDCNYFCFHVWSRKRWHPFTNLWMKINEIVVIWYFSKIVVCIFEFLPWTTNCRHCSYCARKVCKCFWSKMRILASTTTARKADHYHACFRVICHKVAHLSLQHIQVLFSSAGQMNFKITRKIRYSSCFLKDSQRLKFTTLRA